MCELGGQRGCCIGHVRKVPFMLEKRAGPRLNNLIGRKDPAVSVSRGSLF